MLAPSLSDSLESRMPTDLYIYTKPLSARHGEKLGGKEGPYELGEVVRAFRQVIIDQPTQSVKIRGRILEPLALVAHVAVQLGQVLSHVVDDFLVAVHEFLVHH